MRVKLLGYQKVDFKDDSGSGIRGTSIFISYTENGVQGEKAEKKFLPDGFELPALRGTVPGPGWGCRRPNGHAHE